MQSTVPQFRSRQNKENGLMNLKRVMELGAKNLLDLGNPERNYLPLSSTVCAISNGNAYTYQWRGDEVVGVTPNIDQRPFYQ